MSYKERAKDRGEVIDVEAEPVGTCVRCRASRQKKILASHGGMCEPCFKAYCCREFNEIPRREVA